MVCARSMPGSGSARAPALDCFFEARVVCEFQYGLKNKLEEGKLFMQSLFKKIRSSRTTRIVGCGLALLLAGVSLASYSYKGTKSFGKNADNKSSLVQASQPSQAKINESVGKLPLAFDQTGGCTCCGHKSTLQKQSGWYFHRRDRECRPACSRMGERGMHR